MQPKDASTLVDAICGPYDEAADEQGEHGVEGAAYRRDAGGKTPTLFCLCGFEAEGETWETAGAALDAHLAQVLRGAA